MLARTALRLAFVALLVALVTACEDVDDVDELAIDTDVGVTDEPCPDAVNEGNGCIYLGALSDDPGGEFGAIAEQLTAAQAAFWARVNERGGIGGYDIDVTTHVHVTGAEPEGHRAAFEELRAEVLALTQTLGAAATAEILDDLDDEDMLAVPASATSAWLFTDVILESGASYCVAAANALDHAVDELDEVETVLAVHYRGQYGADAAAGVSYAADAHDVEFVAVETRPGAEEQAAAIDEVLAEQPDVLFVATGPLEMSTIASQAAARGFDGHVLGPAPTWDPALLESPAAELFEERYWLAAAWPPWDADTPGHEALRDALDDAAPRDGYLAGWISQYPLQAAIEAAFDRGDLTRAGLRAALEDLDEVDYEGMLPGGAGHFAGEDPDDQAVRESLVLQVDPEASTGTSVRADFFAGSTIADVELTRPCFEEL